jgi:hypothetical protein
MDVARQAVTSSRSPSVSTFGDSKIEVVPQESPPQVAQAIPRLVTLYTYFPPLLVPAFPVYADSPSPRMVTHIRPSHSGLASPDPNTLVLLVHGGICVLITRLEERW